MKVIMFNSIKGGVGKSTLAAQFVAYLSHKSNVGVIDADPQKTLSTWAERRAEFSENNMRNITVLPLHFDFSNENLSLDYIVIDSTGIDSEIGRRMLLEADVVISPLRPSQADIDTILTHYNLIQEAKQYNPKIELYYLLNACSTNWRDKERKDALSILNYLKNNEFSDAKVIEKAVFDRAVLRSSFSEGLSCFDVKENKSKRDIKDVLDVILGGE